MKNGEFPESLNAKVFWLLIGTNDLGGDHCSVESIVAGNIRIVEEIRRRRPKSKVVINSILPRTEPIGVNLWGGMNTRRRWSQIMQINARFECYAASSEGGMVEFFNATEVFVEANGTREVREYYADIVHPSAAGHDAWAKSIVERVLNIILEH